MRASLVVPFIAATFLVFAPASPAQILITRDEVKHDESPALRDMAAAARSARVGKPLDKAPEEAAPVRSIPLPEGFKPLADPDMVLQQTASAAPADLAPTLLQNFDGIGEGVAGFFVPGAPPDTNGAVGLSQYVQWVNLSFAVYDKATTNLLLGPALGNTLWTGFGGPCEGNNDGDPMALYDKQADRWVLSQFVVRGPAPGGFGPNFLQCVAVSKTSDATGAYNRYAFSYSAFDDYPKMGVWPDAYYVTFNMFTPPSLNFTGANACAYDRNAMLNGLAATQVCFQQGANILGLLPSDVDGLNPPPAGEPNFLMHFTANALNLYKFHVDFATPGNSAFTGPVIVPVSPFTPLCNGSRGCVPQSGTTTKLDSLADRLMYRLAYRNFGDHESLVVNHSVAANTSSGGVRWYEIQNPAGTPVVAQQSTFAPDANFRWMGSIAMDHAGDMALGYSVSSATMFPSIAFTARLSGDPASTMQTESAILAGAGSQIAGLTRWGDYSAMQIDPSDDCTFWYTTEYLKGTGIFNWNTRIASFKFPGCNFPDLQIAKTHTGNFTQGQTGATFTITVANVGLKSTDGTTVTVTDALPAKLTATAAAGTGWTCVLSPSVSCTRSDVLASNASYPPITLTVSVAADAPGLLTNTANVSGGGDQGTPGNNQTSDTVTIIQTGPDLAITKTHPQPFIQNQPGVYTITVSNVGLSPTSGALVTVTDQVPAGLPIASVNGGGWTCSPAATNPVSCTRTDVLAAGGSYPAIALTVTPPTAPAAVSNTASVTGGGDTNPFNNSATDPTTIVVPPPDLSITKTHTGNFNQGQGSASYTLTVTNAGLGPSVGTVTVKENLPTGLGRNFIFGTGWTCDIIAMACTRGDSLAVGSSYPPITVTVSVDGNAPATVINTATVSGGTDITPGNNTATDPTTILPEPDLTLAVSHSPDPLVQGQEGTYTIVVGNQGSAATSGFVSMTDNLPFGMIATDLVAPGWNCVGSSFISCSRSDTLAPGAAYPSIVLTVFVVNPFSQVSSSVNVSGGGELNLRNDSVIDVANVIAPRLFISATSSASTFTVGQTGTYTISIKNTGTGPTTGQVNVQDGMPLGFTAIGIAAPGWSCSPPPVTSVVKCTRADSLAPAATYPSIVVAVSVVGGGNLSAFSNFQATGGGDPNFEFTSIEVNVVSPVLSIALSSGNFLQGQGAYTIMVGNTGKVSTLGTVTVTDNLTLGLTATGFTGTGWNCGPFPAQMVSCTRSDVLPPAQSYPPVTIAVSAGISGSIGNGASVTGGGDIFTHIASSSDFINPFIILSMTKSHIGNFTVGQSGVYTIAINNIGSLPSSGLVTMNDGMPAGLLATAVDAPGWTCLLQPILVNCTRSDSLAAGASYPPITITVSVTGSGPVITNQASITGGGDLQFRFASDTTTIISPQLAIAKTHTGTFTVGQPAAYTLNVSNTGTMATSGTVTVSDPLPAGMSLTTFTGDGWTCGGTQSVTCTRSDALAAGAGYPALTLNISIGDVASATVNTASVTGGGDTLFHFASDPTSVITPVLSITKSHVPDPMVVGQTGTYTISINNVGTISTVGTVTMKDNLPGGLTATGASGPGWTCSGTTTVTCTRSDVLAPNSGYPAITVPVNVTGGFFSFVNVATVSGGGVQFAQSNFDSTNLTAPQLSLALSHNGSLTIGQPGTLTATVGNVGAIPSLGVVNLNAQLPSGITATASGGTGWTCSGSAFVTCSRSDALAPGSSYPAITMTVVASSAQNVTYFVTLSGGGDVATHGAFDSIFVNTPSLTITKSHAGVFAVGQSATYTIAVSNPGPVASAGLVMVNDVLPTGLTATAVNSPASGWTCSTPPVTVMVCSRSDVLAAGTSYPSIVMTVSVDATVPGAVVNQAVLSGGGDLSSHTAFDLASATLPDLAIAAIHQGDFAAGQPGTYTITVTNVGATPTSASGTVVVEDFLPLVLTASSVSGNGWTCTLLAGPPQQANCTRPGEVLTQGAGYPPITLTVNVAPDAPISTVTNVADVFGGSDADLGNNTALDNTHIAGFRFVPVTPCRIADTRNATGPFGGPFIGANATREIDIPSSACGIPAAAQAYSLNITVVPKGTLGFLTMFPCGQNRPLASTLNSIDGRTKAAAAILPAGTNGSVCAFPTNDTDLVMDIDGYFVPASVPAGLAFYPVTPCRLVDTRLAAGPLGGPSLAGNAARTFPLLTSTCAVPAAAKAYSLNYTVVPSAGQLGFLTTWPAGGPQPLVSTLNAPTGAVTANAAIVPAGTNGDVSVFVTHPTDLVVDIDGYFAAPGTGGLSLQNVTPCRVLDTRNGGGPPFNGLIGVGVSGSPCAIPITAQSYVLNATVVPPASLGFLTLWPNAAVQPLVSTLNAQDGAITSNMAIVPTTNGFVNAFSSNATHLVLDISGYFVP